MTIRTEKVTFVGSLGETLAARLDRPAGRPVAYALFAHCFSCSKDIFAARRIAEGLAERGVAVLRFDFTGLGHSDGEFANTTFSSNVGDLLKAAEFLQAEYDAPQLLIGHSLGGAAVILAAGLLPSVRAVVTIGAPAAAEHVTHTFKDRLEEIEEKGEAPVELGGRPFTIKREFVRDLAAQRVTEAAGALRRALLILHAPMDDIVGIENATELFYAAKHPRSFVSLDKADHLLSRREDAEFVARLVRSWSERYLTLDTEDPAPKAAPGSVVVREGGPSRFSNAMAAGGFAFAGDQPESLGGAGTGPTPYDYVMLGLGLCTNQTVRMYADRKSFPLERVTSTVTSEKVHCAEVEACIEGKDTKVTVFDVALELEGPLDPETRERILEIAHKCPVHKMLAQDTPVRVTLKS